MGLSASGSGCIGVGASVGIWVARRWGVGWASESVGQLASGRWLGWRVLVENGIEPSVGFCLAIVWVERRRDVGLAIGWRQRCGSIWSGLWWSETAWASWLESRKTASLEIK